MKPHRQRPVSLEDLLRLKRSERPPVEFWQDFDRQLRAKQLSALVRKRPWWQELPSASFAFLTRFRLPLGAAALLALTLVSLRDEFGNSRPVPAKAPVQDAAVVGLPTGESLGALAQTPSSAAESEEVADSEESAHRFMPVAAQQTGTVNPSVSPTPAPAAASGFGSLLPAAPLPTSFASSTSTRLLGTHSGFESRALPTRQPVEPLQQMAAPGESRRSRLLTAMVSSTALEASPRTTARAASRIAEEQLYDQVQRFGARGDRLHVKF